MSGHIVNTIKQLCGHIIAVGVVAENELDVFKAPRAVGEFLGHVDSVAVNMGVAVEGVGVLGVGAAPGEGHSVGVAAVAEYQFGVRIEGTGIGNAQGAVGIAPVQAVGVIDRFAGVDLRKPCLRHGDGHLLSGGQFGIADRKFPGGFIPCGHRLRAGCVLEKLELYIILVVGDAFGQLIHKGILAQERRLRSNGGQRGDNLVVHLIPSGSAGTGGITVGDVIGETVVLAGVGFGFTDGLFQCGHTASVLGVYGHIVVPGISVNGGHGKRDEEGIAGRGDVLGHSCLHHQVQTQCKAGDQAVAIFIGDGHCGSAGLCIAFKAVFYAGCVVAEGRRQGSIQRVGSEVGDAVFRMMGVCCAKADCSEKGGVCKAIQRDDLMLAVFVAVIQADIRNAKGHKLRALNRVAAHGIVYALVVYPGGNIGVGVPGAVCLRASQIVFIQGK